MTTTISTKFKGKYWEHISHTVCIQ